MNIIEMARSVGASPYTNRHFPDQPYHTFSPEKLQAFANAAIAKHTEELIAGAGGPVAKFNWNAGKFEWLTEYNYELHHDKPLVLASALEAAQVEVEMWKATANATVCMHCDAENKRLKAEVERLTSMSEALTNANRVIEKLAAEVERLTKVNATVTHANKAMHEELEYRLRAEKLHEAQAENKVDVEPIPDCGEAGHADGCCGNAQCLPSARRKLVPASALAAEQAKVRKLVEVLKHADQFITNGIELGFIRMPDAETSDPAHETPEIVRAAITKYGEQK